MSCTGCVLGIGITVRGNTIPCDTGTSGCLFFLLCMLVVTRARCYTCSLLHVLVVTRARCYTCSLLYVLVVTRARCYTCSFLNSATSISRLKSNFVIRPKSNFVLRHNFTCTTSNIHLLYFLP